jgi:hypothetical protein
MTMNWRINTTSSYIKKFWILQGGRITKLQKDDLGVKD